MEQVTTDTICAISTPPGRGGIAVARVSGPAAIAIANAVWKGASLADAKSPTSRGLGDVYKRQITYRPSRHNYPS